MDRAEHIAQSMRWNLDRETYLKSLHHRGFIAIDSVPRDDDGWWRVSRHSASVNSAYKCMSVLRLQWPDLEFKVRKPVTRQRWRAEIWARRKR